MAETTDELDHVAHLSLVVLGHRACEAPLPVSHEGYRAHSLTQLIGQLRERLADYPNRWHGDVWNEARERADARRKADREEARAERERRRGLTRARN